MRAGVTVYREWPGRYEIPGVGVPEPWAKRSSRRLGVNDGDPDGGQRKLDFGLLRYKFEIARLEGWEDYERWAASGDGETRDGGWLYPFEDDLRSWSEGNGSRERVVARIVDSRAARHSKIGEREDKSLIDLLNELGMGWIPASGSRIDGADSGCERIVNALEWARDAGGAVTREPRLWVARSCENHVWALENWMGVDGQKGACKEPIDTLRYLYMSGMAEPPRGEWWNVLVLDPAPERNWFMGWYRCVGEGVEGDARTDAPRAPSRRIEPGPWSGAFAPEEARRGEGRTAFGGGRWDAARASAGVRRT